MKRRGPKVRLARQLGIALTPKAAKVMENRPNPPGQHGATPRRKVSGYKKHPPAHLELDRDARSVRVRELPEREQIPVQCETSLVIEYYSW